MSAAALIDTPMYSAAMAARLVGLESARVRRWLQGYSYEYKPRRRSASGRRVQKPLVQRRGTLGSTNASFLDLIDLLFVRKFVETGMSVQKLRKALAEASDLVGDHPFAHRRFWTDGRKIYLEVKERPAEALLELLSGGQWVIAPVIMQVAHQIEFDDRTGLSRRWFPLGKNHPIVVDPGVSFGSPSIVGHGIQTANVFDLFRGEGRSIERAAEWLSLAPEVVKSAVEFEEQLLAA